MLSEETSLSDYISQLKTAVESQKHQIYQCITIKLSDVLQHSSLESRQEEIFNLHSEILSDLEDASTDLLSPLLNLILLAFKDNNSRQCLSEEQKTRTINHIIGLISVSQREDTLVSCFEVLKYSSTVEFDEEMVKNLLHRLDDILSNKTVSVLSYSNACHCIHRFLKEHETKASCFMPIIARLLFLPFNHSSCIVQEIAEKTFMDLPNLVDYSENEEAAQALIKFLKDPYCKELILLFKEKQELYVLRIWTYIVKTLGKNLHSSLPSMTPFFQIIERAFKSSNEDICTHAFSAWKSLIDNFALDKEALNESKKLRFILKPFKNVTKTSEKCCNAICDTWWHLVWSLSGNLSTRFTEVCIPLLEFMLGKNLLDKASSKVQSQTFLLKKSCHAVIRLLEQPPNPSFGKISSPKKLSNIAFIVLQVPLDFKIIVRHFKEIIVVVKTAIETFGNGKESVNELNSLLKSLLYVVSMIIEEKTKESLEAVEAFLNLLHLMVESKLCSPVLCLKCIDILSKLPQKALLSHYCIGQRKPQEVLCTSLIKLLLGPSLFIEDIIANKRFLGVCGRLISAGLTGSLRPLVTADRYVHILKTMQNSNPDFMNIVLDVWSALASPLLDIVEKTQEVNQGDKKEHDFSCFYDILIFPLEHVLSVTPHLQFPSKPAFRLWSNLYKAFVRSASLVSSTLPNEPAEYFCNKLFFKNLLREDLLKEPCYFETVCCLLQTMLECLDFSSCCSANTSAASLLLVKRKQPIANLTALFAFVLTSFFDYYINIEEDVYDSSTVKAQRKSTVAKKAVALDLLKDFFTQLKARMAIQFALESFVPPMVKYFTSSNKRVTTAIGIKLDSLWSVLINMIELHHLGPYDSEFLSLLSPLLEATLSHPRRMVKERTRRFWFGTFALSTALLQIPESLKVILKKNKLHLANEENISATEDFSFTPQLESQEINSNDVVINFENPPPALTHTFIPPSHQKTPSKASKELTVVKEKPGIKMSVDELSSSEFVKIETAVTTPMRKSIRHRKSYVPSMYNDLSQSLDTNPLGSSSEPFEFESSCEILEVKSRSLAGNAPVNNKAATDDSSKSEVASSSQCNLIDLQKTPTTEKYSLTLAFSPNTPYSAESNESKETKPKNCDMPKPPATKSKPHTLPKNKTRGSDSVIIGLRKSRAHVDSPLSLPRSEKEVIVLDDSDEIIPSSQSSADNEASSNPGRSKPVVKSLRGPKRSLKFDSEETIIKKKIIVKNQSTSSKNTSSQDFCKEIENKGNGLIDNRNLDSQPADKIVINEIQSYTISSDCEASEAQVLEQQNVIDVDKIEKTQVMFSTQLENDSEVVIAQNTNSNYIEDRSSNLHETPPLKISDKGSPTSAKENINEDSECPETPLISSQLDVQRAEFDSIRPLKSSENLQVGSDSSIKSDSGEIKAILSDMMEEMFSDKASANNLSPVLSTFSMSIESKTNGEFGKSLLSSIDQDLSAMEVESLENLDVKPKMLRRRKPTTVTKNAGKKGKKRKLTPGASTSKKNKSSSNEISVQDLKEPSVMVDVAVGDLLHSINISVEDATDVSSQIEMDFTPEIEKEEDENVQQSFSKISEGGKDSNNTYHVDEMIRVENIPSHLSDKTEMTLEDNCDQTSETDIQINCKTHNHPTIVRLASLAEPCNLETASESNSESQAALKKSESQTEEGKPDTNNRLPNVLSENSGVDELSGNPLQVNDVSEAKFSKNNSKEISSSTFTPNPLSTLVQQHIDNNKTSVTMCELLEEKNMKVNIDSSTSTDGTIIELEKSTSEVQKTNFETFESGKQISGCDLNSKGSSSDFEKCTSKELAGEGSYSNQTINTEMCENVSVHVIHHGTIDSETKNSGNLSAVSKETNCNFKEDTKIISMEPTAESVNTEYGNYDNSVVSDVKSVLYSMIQCVDEIVGTMLDIENECNADSLACSPFEKINSGGISEDVFVFKANEDIEFLNQCDPSLDIVTVQPHTSNIDTENLSKRKRKIPMRSPFNFRQRSVATSMTDTPGCHQNLTKIGLASKIPASKRSTKPKVKTDITNGYSDYDLNTSVETVSCPIDDIKNFKNENDITENNEFYSVTDGSCQTHLQIITSPRKKVKAPFSPSQASPRTPESPKKLQMQLNNDELTEMNTRLNASTTPQTRRSRSLAASFESSEGEDSGTEELSEAEDFSQEGSGILKKRKLTLEEGDPKVRKVTFASPLVEERLIARLVGTRKLLRKKAVSPKRTVPVDDVTNSPPHESAAECDENIPVKIVETEMSPECSGPVSPLLAHCQQSASSIIGKLTTPAWRPGLSKLLQAKNLHSIGDLCRLNVEELNSLPLRSPKISTLHKALEEHLAYVHKNTDSSCDDAAVEKNSKQDFMSGLADELLKEDNLDSLPSSLLLSLVNRCVSTMASRINEFS